MDVSRIVPGRVSALCAPPIVEIKKWRGLVDQDKLLDLGQAVPNYLPPPALREFLADCAAKPASYFYSPDDGLPRVKREIADAYQDRYGADIHPRDIVLTAGANNAFTNLAITLFSPGDEVLMPAPWYFNHQMILSALGCRVTPVPTSADKGFKLDAADLEPYLGADTRALVLVSPNNPTGATVDRDALQGLYELACKRGILLIVDETYMDFSPVPDAAAWLLRRRHWRETVIHVFTFSKSLSLCGLRIGLLAAHPDLLDQVLKVHDCNTICAPVLGQMAVGFGMRRLRDWLDAQSAAMADKLSLFNRLFRENRPRHFELVSTGAFFAYVRHDLPGTSWQVCRRLALEEHILTVPGEVFGPGQEAYIRLALGNIAGRDFPVLMERLNRFNGGSRPASR